MTDTINREIKSMLNEGHSENDIVNYLMTIHGIDLTLAQTMVKRIKSAIAEESSPKSPSKIKDFSLVFFTTLIGLAIIAALGYFIWNRIATIIDALG
ncbi:MAG: hypothetical protein IJE73_00015 [Muribaculaceae bacterium]|nr:hypothetical protein [Muribaculaceae bacterium]